LILVLLLLITIYLAFEPFWSFIFSILSLGILFNLFFYPIWSLYF
jgi:hypothetical protein